MTEKGVFFIGGPYDPLKPAAIEFFSFLTRRSSKVVQTGKPVSNEAPDLAVSPDGRWIVWCQLDRWESDLMLVDNFR